MTRLLYVVIACALLTACPADRVEEIEHPRLDGLAAPVAVALAEARAAWDEAVSRATDGDQRAEASGRLGQMYQAHHFNRAARGCYRDATRAAPETARWHYYLGVVAQELGAYDEANRAFVAVAELDATLWQAHYRRAEILLALGDTAGAKPLVDQLSEQRGDDAAVLALAGRVALMGQDYALARARLEQAVRLAPEARRLYHPLAQAARALGDVRAANQLLARAGDGNATLVDPLQRELDGLSRSPQFYMQRGQNRFAQKNIGAAAEDFALAAKLAPDDPAALAAYGRALELQGKVAQARTYIRRALELDDRYAVAYYFLGALLERQGEDERALDHYRAAVDADPQYLNPRLLLAHGLMRSGRMAQAAGHYERVATLQPGNITARYYLGLAHLQMGECAQAANALDEARALQQNYAPVLEALVRMQAVCKVETRPADLLEWAQALLAARPGARSGATLAMAYAAAGQFGQAMKIQRDALEVVDNPLSEQAMRADLERYRNGQPPRYAWPPGSAEIHPPRLTAGLE